MSRKVRSVKRMCPPQYFLGHSGNFHAGTMYCSSVLYILDYDSSFNVLLHLPFVSSLLQPRNSCPCSRVCKNGCVFNENGRGLKITHTLMSCPSPHIPILLTPMLSVYMTGFDTGFSVWVGSEREGPISYHGTSLTYLHNESHCMLSTGSLYVLLSIQNSYNFCMPTLCSNTM